jgi:nickel-dependent lactate racemase
MLPAAPLRGIDQGGLAGLALAFVVALEIVAPHEHLAAHFQHGGRRSVLPGAAGIARTVRTFCVTSSPVSPSPRVAACTSTPCS